MTRKGKTQKTNPIPCEDKGDRNVERDPQEQEVLPMTQIQKEGHWGTATPVEFLFKGRINDLTESERGKMERMRLEHGHTQQADFVAPKAVHIVRCPIGQCGAPINTHGLERSIKSHLCSAHSDITCPVLATVIKFNQPHPIRYYFPPPATKSGRRSGEGSTPTQTCTQTQETDREEEKRNEKPQDVDPQSELGQMEVSEQPSLSMCGQQGSPVESISTVEDDPAEASPTEREIELSDPGAEVEENGKVQCGQAESPTETAGKGPEKTAPKQCPPDDQDFHKDLLGNEKKPRQPAGPRDKGSAEKEDEGVETAAEDDPGTHKKMMHTLVGPTNGNMGESCGGV